jgi:hypothetical protein
MLAFLGFLFQNSSDVWKFQIQLVDFWWTDKTGPILSFFTKTIRFSLVSESMGASKAHLPGNETSDEEHQDVVQGGGHPRFTKHGDGDDLTLERAIVTPGF